MNVCIFVYLWTRLSLCRCVSFFIFVNIALFLTCIGVPYASTQSYTHMHTRSTMHI